jgi:acetolactate synthase small subunit
MLLLLAERRPLEQVIRQLEKLQDVVSVKAWPDAREELFQVPGWGAG